MKLDIFEHSRDVMLRNSVIGTLRVRNAAATAHAIDELAAEYAGDSHCGNAHHAIYRRTSC